MNLFLLCFYSTFLWHYFFCTCCVFFLCLLSFLMQMSLCFVKRCWWVNWLCAAEQKPPPVLHRPLSVSLTVTCIKYQHIYPRHIWDRPFITLESAQRVNWAEDLRIWKHIVLLYIPPPPRMIVKRFGCTTIHNKELYKCLIHSFIHSYCPENRSAVCAVLVERLFNISVTTEFIHMALYPKSFVGEKL